MPAATCKTCGRITNSVTSNYWSTHGVPTECDISVDPETKNWVKGCRWDRLHPDMQKMYEEKYIGKSALPSQPPGEFPLANEGDEE